MIGRSDIRCRFVPPSLFFAAALVFFFCVSAFPAAGSPAPPPDTADPAAILSPLLGVPYRNDGVRDAAGRYTLFAEPEKTFVSPGLNCSGLVVQGARLLLRRNISPAAAARDRLGDSGVNAALGRDWDFGWDLVMNITDGLPRRLPLPGGGEGDIAAASGRGPRGYDIHAPSFWPELLERIRPGFLYLAAFSREGGPKPYVLRYYHVGLFIRAADGGVWFYHATPEAGKSSRMACGTEEGRARFLRSFRNTGAVRKMLLLLETPLAMQPVPAGVP